MKLAGLLRIISCLPLRHELQPFGPHLLMLKQEFDRHVTETSRLVTHFEAKQMAAQMMTDMTLDEAHVEFTIQSSYFDGIHHVYFERLFKGLPVANGFSAVHLDPFGTPLFSNRPFFGSSLSPLSFAIDAIFSGHESQPSINRVDALLAFAEYLQVKVHSLDEIDQDYLKLNDFPLVPIQLKFLQVGQATMRLVWDLVLDLDSNWFHVQLDAHTGKLLGLIDWVSHATYNVYPLGYNDPRDGSRERIVDPAHPLASPIGWNTHQSRSGKQIVNKDTQGNNVYAQNNPDGGNRWKSNHRPKGTKNLDFDFPLNLKKDPDSYIDASITNLFYLCNTIHDLFYVYGFTEAAGNFQENNFERGGRGADGVIANSQDGSGTNNANFGTPPDGQHGRMYVWTQTDPERDGDLEAGIVIHEYAHGISTRLTGGPMNSDCLGWGEAGGMGEGWGDFFATILRMNSSSTSSDVYGMGDYSNGGKGIRNYPYSTDKKINPSTYAYIRKPGYWGVHAKGEVWAEILYGFFWTLVEKHGWEDDWFNVPLSNSSTSSYPTAGNKLALRLVVDGLKLQPCSPTFVDARDAILLADKVGTKGENKCDIWKAFAARGLGHEAKASGSEDYGIPTFCKVGNSTRI